MTDIKTDSSSKLNRQMSPLSIAAIAAIAVFAWFTYQYANPVRGLIVSAFVFPLVFYIVWKGQRIEQQQKDRNAARE